MLIRSIKLENFRQFRNESLNFGHCDDGRNVTIIIGQNGTGKSTFLQAFSWCMYGETDFKDKSILNKQVFKEMQKTVNIGEKDSKTTDTMVDYFKDQGIQDLAAQSTENNSLGLAQMLYEQMKINYGISPDAIKEIE